MRILLLSSNSVLMESFNNSMWNIIQELKFRAPLWKPEAVAINSFAFFIKVLIFQTIKKEITEGNLVTGLVLIYDIFSANTVNDVNWRQNLCLSEL